ncbi:MAG: SRPBCC family protein [Minicystis sp.]
MPAVRGLFAHTLPVVVLVLGIAPAHARVVPAPTEGRPPPVYIPASDPGDEPRTSAVPIEGSSLVRGRAIVNVRAPLARVRDTILDFAHYPEFMPHYEVCRVLGTTQTGGRDVYMRIAAVHGVVKMWARIEVAKPTIADGVETYRSRYVDGNIKDLQATWSVKPVDDKTTQLTVEVFMNPKLPLPDALVNNENLDGARAAVLAFKARAEGKKLAEK